MVILIVNGGRAEHDHTFARFQIHLNDFDLLTTAFISIYNDIIFFFWHIVNTQRIKNTLNNNSAKYFHRKLEHAD